MAQLRHLAAHSFRVSLTPTSQDPPSGPLRRFLFPSPPRSFAGQRAVKILLRSLHVLAVAGLFGVVFAGVGNARAGSLHLALLSGAAILALDLFESAAFLLQVRGLVVLGKLAALALLYRPGIEDGLAAAILAVLIVFSVISSHAPSKFRYRFWVPGVGVEGAKSRG